LVAALPVSPKPGLPMRQFVRLLCRFRRDERGVFGIIFALIAVVVIALAGAAVDYTSMQQARTKAQVALDAAALALQPTIYTATASNIQSQSQALLVDRLKDPVSAWTTCNPPVTNPATPVTLPCITVNSPTKDTTAGSLTLTATMTVPMNFVSLIGFPSLTAQITSVATRQKLNLEVAMVLDNSGSMSTSFGTGTRMSTLQTAATCAVDILFYNDASCSSTPTGTLIPNVKIGIVPFTEEVNIGHSLPAADIDRSGMTNGTTANGNPTTDSLDFLHTLSGDRDGLTGVDRIGLFANMKDSSGTVIPWGGCLQARAHTPNPYDTDATTPTASNPYTLYTPYFAVDEPGAAGSAGNAQNGFFNSYIDDSTPKNKANACTNNAVCTITKVSTLAGILRSTTTLLSAADGETWPTCSCSLLTTTTTTTTTLLSQTKVQTCNQDFAVTLTQPQLQARLCKYNGAQMTSAVNLPYVFGPNGDCPVAASQPLNTSPSTIISAIANMQPNGGTNITEGAAWGFRLLSPGDPFNAQPFGAATSKNLIIMTDGENTAYPGSNMNDTTYNSAYGFLINGRLLPASAGTSNLTNTGNQQQEMNTRLAAVCANAKNAGITVYTVGVDTVDTSNPTYIHNLLANCASSAGDAFFPSNGQALVGDFQNIASQLAALRLSK
jgi:Flp pilus assembly protein TadG